MKYQTYLSPDRIYPGNVPCLYPIRIYSMNGGQIITPDDELYLRVELKRVLKAMGFAM